MTEITREARLIQSPAIIFRESRTVSLEKGNATVTLFRGDTTLGAERDRTGRVLLRLAMTASNREGWAHDCAAITTDGRQVQARDTGPNGTFQQALWHLVWIRQHRSPDWRADRDGGPPSAGRGADQPG